MLHQLLIYKMQQDFQHQHSQGQYQIHSLLRSQQLTRFQELLSKLMEQQMERIRIERGVIRLSRPVAAALDFPVQFAAPLRNRALR